ncbi:response regulator [Bacillus weihaiensis]|uniref:response regulator n=1 Tax=Bacillus weihaiensis TaxID=1547283 RepID=UPI0023556033|nr:response regulator [Bacillus weihaiensis]
MLKTVIIEDEPHILEMMRYYLNQLDHYNIVGTYTDSTKALKEIPNLHPDVLFIDIEMPGLNGMELAGKIKNEANQIVFTTAYSQYAVEAFRVEASDYLLKPVTLEDLNELAPRLTTRKQQQFQALSSMIPLVTIKCFGSFQVINESNKLVKWPTKKTEELFAYLLTKKEEIISKWELADVLWPDKDGERAVHNVHNTIYRMKKTLNEYNLPISIHSMNQGYYLEVKETANVDLYEFEQLSTGNKLSIEVSERLKEIYQGELFQNKDYPWSALITRTYEMTHEKCVEILLKYYKEIDQEKVKLLELSILENKC